MALCRWLGRTCGGALLAVSTQGAAAQGPAASISGTVRDSAGQPVPLARLTIADIRTLSDSAGRFFLGGLAAGSATLAVRRLGYAPRDMTVRLANGRTDSLTIVLAALAQELAGVVTEAESARAEQLSEFYRHRRAGIGHFFDRPDIEKRNAQRVSDVLRRIPGVRLVPDRNGRYQLRLGRSAVGRDCPPDFWIDGIRAPYLNVDDIPLSDVEALEMYDGPSGVPPEMNSRFGNPACGAVVIWTRVPG